MIRLIRTTTTTAGGARRPTRRGETTPRAASAVRMVVGGYSTRVQVRVRVFRLSTGDLG